MPRILEINDNIACDAVKTRLTHYALLIVSFFLILYSCDKDNEEKNPPVISCVDSETRYHLTKMDQFGEIKWERCFTNRTSGGFGLERQASMLETADGEYIIALPNEQGNFELVGISPDDNQMLWVKEFESDDNVKKITVIKEMNDGGFLMIGTIEIGFNVDLWIAKLNSNMEIIVETTFGGSREDFAYDALCIADGAIVISGTSNSTDGDRLCVYGTSDDFWLIKLDSSLEIIWQNCFGGEFRQISRSIKLTNDFGYIILGNNQNDIWTVKTDSLGNSIWKNSYGGSLYDRGWSIERNNSDYYIIGTTTKEVWNTNVLLIRIDIDGKKIWDKEYGGFGYDVGRSIDLTKDGGLIIGCSTSSRDGDVMTRYGYVDCRILKLDYDGEIEWQKTIGLEGRTFHPVKILATSDGGSLLLSTVL